MRFQIRETMQTTDTEKVLRALESCLRDVTSEATTSDHTIVLRGLGPSPVSMNKRDVTVLQLRSEDDKTVIDGDVNFQASALLGDFSQDAVVRAKLERVFERVKVELSYEIHAPVAQTEIQEELQDRSAFPAMEEPGEPGGGVVADHAAEVAAASAEAMEAPAAPAVILPSPLRAPEPMVEAVSVAAPGATEAVVPAAHPEAAAASDSESSVESVSVADTEATEAAISFTDSEAAASSTPKPIVEPDFVKPDSVAAQRGTPALLSAPEPVLTARSPAASDPTAPEVSAESASATPLFWADHLRVEPKYDEVSRSKRGSIWILTLAVLLSIGGGLVYLRERSTGVFFAAKTVAPPATALEAPRPQPKIPAAVEHPEQTVAPKESLPPVAGPSADLKTWLDSWAAAMRTRDPVMQSSFYADAVDQYLDQRNITREGVMKDRESILRMRKGLWTVKMEKIVIEQQTETEAKVRLVKHFIDEPATSEIMESFVPTRLTLKRVNGNWKITSEQDLPAYSVDMTPPS